MRLPAEMLTEPAEYLAFWSTAIGHLLGMGMILVIILGGILLVLLLILRELVAWRNYGTTPVDDL